MKEAIKTNYPALITLTTVFFFWGFVAASNDILIPVFKEELKLAQWQSQMISFAFYAAYFIGAILYIVISTVMKKDILLRVGYKKGIAIGLIISALGTLLFIPAATFESFTLMITGLFVVGLGFSLQQTAANPLVISLGDPTKGSQRLSLAGGVNNLGTTIGPVLIALAIFGQSDAASVDVSIDSIRIPYLILGLAFILVAILIYTSKIPNHLTKDEETITDTITETGTTSSSKKGFLDFPQLYLGMIAIFVYVGVEVATAGNLGEYLKVEYGMSSSDITPYVSLYWASLMIGRWTSAAGVFSKSKLGKLILCILLPYGAFGVFILINSIGNNDLTPIYYYGFVIAIIILAEYLSKGNPGKQLSLFSGLGIIALLIGMFSTGIVGIYAIVSVGLFASTLWPCIFTLALGGLGNYTGKGSGYLIMMILGGGIISLAQGFIAELNGVGIRLSFFVGVVCFAYLLFYAIRSQNILKKQGVKIAE